MLRTVSETYAALNASVGEAGLFFVNLSVAVFQCSSWGWVSHRIIEYITRAGRLYSVN